MKFELVIVVAALTVAGCVPQPDAPGPLCRTIGFCMGTGARHRQPDPEPSPAPKTPCWHQSDCLLDQACVADRYGSQAYCVRRS